MNQRRYRPLPTAAVPIDEDQVAAQPLPGPESAPDPVPDSGQQRGPRWASQRTRLATVIGEHSPHPRSWRCTACLHPWPCLACQEALLADSVTDPGQTHDTAHQFLQQAAVALTVPPDVLRYRFLPWTLDRTDQLRHPVNRYTFDCQHCEQPWPCPPARIELVEAYAGDPLGLADLMTRLFVEATTNSGLPRTELIERFITWSSTMLDSLGTAAAWSPAGTHNTAIIESRHALEAHWPESDGRCPLCDVPDCWGFRTAVAFLSDHTPGTPFPSA